MKKIPLKSVKGYVNTLIFIIVALSIFASTFPKLSMPLFLSETAVLILMAVLIIKVWRCPKCGRWLGLSLNITHCPKCGKSIDPEVEDLKPAKKSGNGKKKNK